MESLVLSQRGKTKLVRDGFTYVFDKMAADRATTFWRCGRKDVCRARVHVRHGEVVKFVNEHSHGVSSAPPRAEGAGVGGATRAPKSRPSVAPKQIPHQSTPSRVPKQKSGRIEDESMKREKPDADADIATTTTTTASLRSQIKEEDVSVEEFEMMERSVGGSEDLLPLEDEEEEEEEERNFNGDSLRCSSFADDASSVKGGNNEDTGAETRGSDLAEGRLKEEDPLGDEGQQCVDEDPLTLTKAFGNDQFSVFGGHVASSLRNLESRTSRTVAKFLISKIIYHAEVGNYDKGLRGYSISDPFDIGVGSHSNTPDDDGS